MRVKATVSFSGAVTMAAGEERDIPEGAALSDLLSCGYVVPTQAEKPNEKAVKTNDAKRGKG